MCENKNCKCNGTCGENCNCLDNNDCCHSGSVCHEEYCEWPNHYVASVDDEGNKYNEEGEFCDNDGNPYPTPEEWIDYCLSTDKMFKERYNNDECENKKCKCDETCGENCKCVEELSSGTMCRCDNEKTVDEVKNTDEGGYLDDDRNPSNDPDFKALYEMVKDIVSQLVTNLTVEVYFAAEEGVEVPTKRPEDMGFDVKSHFEEDEFVFKPHETRLVPTGLYSAVPSSYGLIAKEKGSTGSLGMKLGAGVIDSGYRGEIFIAITNDNPIPLVITKDETVKKAVVTEEKILYPYKKGIAQLVVVANPNVLVKQVSVDELKAIPSQRGEGKLGSTDKL